ncbi:MAG: NTP transferase domain-containing protein [Elusimicrobia bacterium]|nr:NTP transferase domain-containing protein [Candidatus Liberimonas magnetica]
MNAIIMVAGIGSRLGKLSKRIPKCLVEINKNKRIIDYSIRSLVYAGAKNIIIVVGHKYKMIKTYVTKKYPGLKIKFVYNKYYKFHGSGYSLALGALEIDSRIVVITEGDLLIPKEYYKRIGEGKYNQVCLNRNIDPYRSVVALGGKRNVREFIYDPKHGNIYDSIENKDQIIGESVQLWCLKEGSVGLMKKVVKSYLNRIENSNPDKATNLFPINKVIAKYPMHYIFAKKNKWFNINTLEDVKKARSSEWVKKY